MRQVTRRRQDAVMFPRQQAEAFEGLSPVEVGKGTPEDLGDLEAINGLFEEGDLGELQLYLSPDAPEDVVTEAAAGLDAKLRERGAVPWPGETYTVFVDWPARTLHLRFQQGMPFLLLVSALIVEGAATLAGISILNAALSKVGVQLPTHISNLKEAAALIAVLIGVGIFLPALLPASLLIAGGLALFTLLRPDTAWRIFKWVATATLGLLEKLGLSPMALALGAGLSIVGLGLVAVGVGKGLG